uniref:Uncharacterized protein n=1 Tax=Marmota marmota marmota TaxID=9994 RepID=A0A8C5YKG3_MARMA
HGKLLTYHKFSSCPLFSAHATVCMVCNIFKNGKCVEGKGNCTLKEGGECRTRDIYSFTLKDGFFYNYTILDCSKPCKAWRLVHGYLRVASFCCRSRNFCNRYHGKIAKQFVH